jgi:hypothetical protein
MFVKKAVLWHVFLEKKYEYNVNEVVMNYASG